MSETVMLNKYVSAGFDDDGDLEIIDRGDIYSTLYLNPDEFLKLRDLINEHIRTINQIDSSPRENIHDHAENCRVNHTCQTCLFENIYNDADPCIDCGSLYMDRKTCQWRPKEQR